MFTGIIQGLGLLQTCRGGTIEVEVPPHLWDRLTLGGSLSVNGVCLTVRELARPRFVADLTRETRDRTTFQELRRRVRLNLELPVTPERAFDGHMVLGHVDTTGRVRAISRTGEGWTFVFSYPSSHRHYVAEKGSIAVDGISLTIAHLKQNTIGISIVPYTVQKTTLVDKQVGDSVNIETDIVARYVEKFTASGGAGNITIDKLKNWGY